MSEINRPEINGAALASQIREAIAQRMSTTEHPPVSTSASKNLAGRGPRAPSNSPSSVHVSIPRLRLQPDFEAGRGNSYHVNDLLKFHDGQFVRNAYRAILNREPDDAGYENYVERLRSGSINKLDVLASLRFSGEGRSKHVRVNGLALPTAIRRLKRLPILGYAIRLASGLLRLPVLMRHQRQFEGYVLAQNQQIADHMNNVSVLLAEHFQKLSVNFAAEISELLAKHQSIVAGQQKLRDEVNVWMAEVVAKFGTRLIEETAESQRQVRQLIGAHETRTASVTDELRSEVARFHNHLQHLRSELVLHGQRVTVLLEEARQSFTAISAEQLPDSVAIEERHTLDALYAALEDQFRGSRQEIKKRFEVYLPHVKAAVPPTDDALVVDIGCGRGEWLELLRETGFKAQGVDENRVMIARCRERGLDAVEVGALTHLRSLPDNSISAVTGFHIIEHLPVEALIQLVDETIRVIRPGGLVIFETPNPENVLVGSNYFHLDPTHLRPIPSLLMKFLLEARGLSRIEVLNLHPWDSARVGDITELAARFNDLFYGPMDYAVIGWKV